MQVAILNVLAEEGAFHLLPKPSVKNADALVISQFPASHLDLVEVCVELLADGKLQKAIEENAPLVAWSASIVRRFLLSGIQMFSKQARINLQTPEDSAFMHGVLYNRSSNRT